MDHGVAGWRKLRGERTHRQGQRLECRLGQSRISGDQFGVEIDWQQDVQRVVRRHTPSKAAQGAKPAVRPADELQTERCDSAQRGQRVVAVE